jgi:hypothetical protein
MLLEPGLPWLNASSIPIQASTDPGLPQKIP